MLPAWLRGIALCLSGFLLMTLSAQVRFAVPGTDVPMTLQPLTMLVIGMTLPVSASAGAMLLYLMLGGMGVPVFAGDGGLTGSTGGYLFGFLIGAPVVGIVSGLRRDRFIRLFVAGMVGMGVVLSCGVVWRILRFGGAWEWALVTGAAPFLLKALVESALASAVALKIRAAKS